MSFGPFLSIWFCVYRIKNDQITIKNILWSVPNGNVFDELLNVSTEFTPKLLKYLAAGKLTGNGSDSSIIMKS